MKDQPNIIYLHCLSRSGTDERLLRSWISILQSFSIHKLGREFNATFCASLACNPSRACTWTGQYAHTKETLKWR